MPVSDHVPPVSAAPNPFDTVRLNVSEAYTSLGGGSVDEVTVTDRLSLSVRPPSSVTVSATEYVPAVA